MADFSFEQKLKAKGVNLICGVDEAGRGPLAGPIVAACVMFHSFDEQLSKQIAGLNDSKKLSPKKRQEYFEIIMKSAHIGICALPPKIIDEKNILKATLLAMKRAIFSLSLTPNHILIDGRDIPKGLNISATSIISGDNKSLSIAAASIIAKQMRDSMCLIMDRDNGEYGFAGHKGYSTKKHIEALNNFGACQHHRFSYAPVARVKNK